MSPSRLLLWVAVFLAGAGAGGAGVWFWRPPAASERSHPDDVERRWEATIYLPAPGQAGGFTEKDHQEALGLLVREFEGLTLGAEEDGFWQSEKGKIEREKVRPVIVSFEPARLGRFREVLDQVGKRLEQEALYVRYEKPAIEVRKLKRP
jgi:hypothetical protein